MRHKLKKGSKDLTSNALKALWCALDDDDSNEVHKDELAGFFKRGFSKQQAAAAGARQHSSTTLLGAISGDRVGTNRAIEPQATKGMREELAAAGVALPTSDELTKLSTQLVRPRGS